MTNDIPKKAQNNVKSPKVIKILVAQLKAFTVNKSKEPEYGLTAEPRAPMFRFNGNGFKASLVPVGYLGPFLKDLKNSKVEQVLSNRVLPTNIAIPTSVVISTEVVEPTVVETKDEAVLNAELLKIIGELQISINDYETEKVSLIEENAELKAQMIKLSNPITSTEVTKEVEDDTIKFFGNVNNSEENLADIEAQKIEEMARNDEEVATKRLEQEQIENDFKIKIDISNLTERINERLKTENSENEIEPEGPSHSM